MTPPTDTLSDLIARVDLPAMVDHWAGPGRGNDSHRSYRCPNPSHDDRSPSFSVYRGRDGKWRGQCFGSCDWNGDALDFLQWVNGCSREHALDLLRQWVGAPTDTPRHPVSRPAHQQTKRTPAPTRPVAPTDPAADWKPFPDPGGAARIMDQYLTRRGWPTWVVDTFGLTVVLDRWNRARIRHPYHAWDGTDWAVCAWQDRATMPKAQPRWLTPTGAVLPPYNARTLDRLDLSGVIVTEGPADAITATVALGTDADRFAVIGIPGSKGWRADWAALVAGHPVVIAADPDTSGQTLVDSIRSTYTGPRLAVVRFTHGDLTDTVTTVGADQVRELLLAPFGPAVHHQDDSVDPAGPGPEPVEPVGSTPDRLNAWAAWEALEHLGPHRWQVCDTCQAAALTGPGKRCYMTPGCSGTFQPRPAMANVSTMGVAS